MALGRYQLSAQQAGQPYACPPLGSIAHYGTFNGDANWIRVIETPQISTLRADPLCMATVCTFVLPSTNIGAITPLP